MFLYEGILVKQDNKYVAAILLMSHGEPNCDTVMEKEFDDENVANIWLDDEMSRLTSGRGVWDV